MYNDFFKLAIKALQMQAEGRVKCGGIKNIKSVDHFRSSAPSEKICKVHQLIDRCPAASKQIAEPEQTMDINISDEEDEEEVEPQLKYRRLMNDVTTILKKHAASCIAVNAKFLALGSHWGTISIIDHLGNNIKSAKLLCHTTTVNQISIDENGDHIASCSDDGRVLISGLYSSDNNVNISFDRPIKAIAIDPDFYKSGSGRRFLTGDEKLILHEKSFMSRMRTTVILEGDGTIRNLQWKGQFVACSSDLSVRIFDSITLKTICTINREHSVNLRPELYRCSLVWKDNTTLLIGWANHVKICQMKPCRTAPGSPKEGPSHYAEMTCRFTTDFYISGIAPYGNNLVVLSYAQEEQETPTHGNAKRPQLHVIQPHTEDCDEISTDVLSIKGFAEYRCNDYHLDSLTEEGVLVIVSPRDVVIAEPRDADDHIVWLMEHSRYEEALNSVKQNDGKDLKQQNLLQVGKAYINYLLEKADFDKAARLCVEILGKDKLLWENEVYKFANVRQLKAIAPYLPRGDVKLESAIYEMVLNEFLLTDTKGFQSLIREWPSSMYKVPTLINAVIDQLICDPANPILLQCLGDLYTFERQYDKSLAIYLKLGHKDVFELIKNHKLFGAIHDKLEILMQLDTETATKMFLENLDKIPLDTIVQKLDQSPNLLCQFLDRLFVKDPILGEEYHGLQVKLYARWQPHKLLSFLRNSNFYPLQEALDICQTHQMTSEMVFLLGRMGNTKQALQLILEELQDVDRAIEFCKEHDDKDLWEDLINVSLSNPKFINTLLNNIGTHVDPIMIIQRIAKDMEIPGLRDSLVKILQDYTLQVSLREGCKKILVSDCFSLLDKLNKQQKKGIAVLDDQICPICACKILSGDDLGGVIVFWCRHSFHEVCLPTLDSCFVCHTQKRNPGNSSKDN